MRTGFEEKLQQMNNNLIKMGLLIEEAIASSVQALKKGDHELAEKVMDSDKAVDDMEKTIESQSLNIMLREQPVATDLRKVTSALKIVTDMERIGDNAADIAEISITADMKNVFHLITEIDKMTGKTIAMVNDAVTAFVETRLDLARDVTARDDEVDDLFNLIKRKLVDVVKADENNTDIVVDVLMIIKYLERIADHAVNICEWVEFSKTGEYKNTRII